MFRFAPKLLPLQQFSQTMFTPLAWYSDRSFPLDEPGLAPDTSRGVADVRGGVHPTSRCPPEDMVASPPVFQQ